MEILVHQVPQDLREFEVFLAYKAKKERQEVMVRQDLLVLLAVLESEVLLVCLVFQDLKDIEVSLDWMELKEILEDPEKREKMEHLDPWALLVQLVQLDNEEKEEEMVHQVSLE